MKPEKYLLIKFLHLFGLKDRTPMQSILNNLLDTDMVLLVFSETAKIPFEHLKERYLVFVERQTQKLIDEIIEWEAEKTINE